MIKSSGINLKARGVRVICKSFVTSQVKSLFSDVTGLSHPIWVHRKTGKEKHGPRIKVACSTKNLKQNFACSISISSKPQVFHCKNGFRTKEFVQWVEENYDLLIKHANGEIDDKELIKLLKKRLSEK